MDCLDLQKRLRLLGCYRGDLDGRYGPLTRAGLLQALTDGPDHRLTESDVADAAKRLDCTPAHVWTVWEVESSGSPFINGRPTILPERHRFSRATKGRFDKSHPRLSAPNWDRTWYPATQAARYEVLLDMVGLDVDAGFASCSYGGFQILGENYDVCGAPSPWAFAWRQAQTEGDQLDAFVNFVIARGLDRALRRNDWVTFARGYNGTAYKKNRYDAKLANAYRSHSR